MKRLSLLLFILLLTACLPPSGTPPIIESPPAADALPSQAATVTPTLVSPESNEPSIEQMAQDVASGKLSDLSQLTPVSKRR
jgi:uncharacterized lipoprotein YajG